MRTEIQIDADFIRRIYRTSIVVWAVVAMVVYGQWGGTPAIGLTIGTTLALASLWSLEWAVRSVIVPGAAASAGKRVAALGALKMVAIGAVLAAVIVTGQRLHANMLALLLGMAGGFFLVHMVMLLKAVGIWLLGQGAAVTAADQQRIRAASGIDTD